MESNFQSAIDELKALKAQYAAIGNRIELLDEYVRIHRQLYGGETQSLLFPAPPEPTGNKGAAILTAVDRLLADGKRKSTRELLKLLANQGITVGGKDQVLSLSSYLSREKERYSSSRKEGWGLKILE